MPNHFHHPSYRTLLIIFLHDHFYRFGIFNEAEQPGQRTVHPHSKKCRSRQYATADAIEWARRNKMPEPIRVMNGDRRTAQEKGAQICRSEQGKQKQRERKQDQRSEHQAPYSQSNPRPGDWFPGRGPAI